MDSPTLALARRVAAHPRWRWMPGALDAVSALRCQGGLQATSAPWAEWRRVGYPDIDDPATMGCLEHLVREVWVDVDLIAWPANGRWAIWSMDAHGSERVATGPTRAAAWAEALLAAPETKKENADGR